MIAVALALAATHALPADVRALAARHASCVHWQGEEPYDAARAREIARAVAAECRGLDAKRRRLLRRYRAHPQVRARLQSLEEVGS